MIRNVNGVWGNDGARDKFLRGFNDMESDSKSSMDIVSCDGFEVGLSCRMNLGGLFLAELRSTIFSWRSGAWIASSWVSTAEALADLSLTCATIRCEISTGSGGITDISLMGSGISSSGAREDAVLMWSTTETLTDLSSTCSMRAGRILTLNIE